MSIFNNNATKVQIILHIGKSCIKKGQKSMIKIEELHLSQHIKIFSIYVLSAR